MVSRNLQSSTHEPGCPLIPEPLVLFSVMKVVAHIASSTESGMKLDEVGFQRLGKFPRGLMPPSILGTPQSF